MYKLEINFQLFEIMKRDLDKKKKVSNVYNNTGLKDKTSETTVRSLRSLCSYILGSLVHGSLLIEGLFEITSKSLYILPFIDHELFKL